MKSITNEIKKSINFEKTGTKGIMVLGKYTFVKIVLLDIKLWDEKLNAVEKYVHGIKAV